MILSIQVVWGPCPPAVQISLLRVGHGLWPQYLHYTCSHDLFNTSIYNSSKRHMVTSYTSLQVFVYQKQLYLLAKKLHQHIYYTVHISVCSNAFYYFVMMHWKASFFIYLSCSCTREIFNCTILLKDSNIINFLTLDLAGGTLIKQDI